jgi:hypothetical protein
MCAILMLKTEEDSPLTKEQWMALLKLASHTYQPQADICYKANAPLASCIMIGAVVEGTLTVVTNLLYEEALKTGKAPVRDGKPKPLLEWSFFELLKVAIAASWLPEEVTLAEKLCSLKTPVLTDSIRQVRNLVHPARYLQNRGGKDYTREELRILYATCHAVHDCLQKLIIDRYPQFSGRK